MQNERYGPMRPEILEKLKRSAEVAEGIPVRAIRCPCCGFYLLNVHGNGHYLVQVKCRKCKFQQTIDTALFRTVRNRSKIRFRAGKRHGKDLYLY